MGQVGARGVGQDLLDDGGHHGLVVAVPAAEPQVVGSQRGEKRKSAQPPVSPGPSNHQPQAPSLPPLIPPLEKGGLCWLKELGAGTELAQGSP